jgi:hypothetical protein
VAIVDTKYDKTLSQIQVRPAYSPFWKELMGVKNEFFARGSFFKGDGRTTRFWEDTWLGATSLASQYPSLYSIVQHKNVTVAQVLLHTPLNIACGRVFIGTKWIAWYTLWSV